MNSPLKHEFLTEEEKKVLDNYKKVRGEEISKNLRDELIALVSKWGQLPTKEELERTQKTLKEWTDTFKCQSATVLKDKIENITQELEKWTSLFDSQTHEEVNQKLKELEKRPDIPITEEEWKRDWSQRVNQIQSEEDQQAREELTEIKDDLKIELGINYPHNWKNELIELKRSKNIKDRLKITLDLKKEDPLPIDWVLKITKRENLDETKKVLEEAQTKLSKWTNLFPNCEPAEVALERKKMVSLESQLNLLTKEKNAHEQQINLLRTAKTNKDHEISELKDKIDQLNQQIDKLITEKDDYFYITKEDYQKLVGLLQQKYPSSETISSLNQILFQNAINRLPKDRVKEKLGDMGQNWETKLGLPKNSSLNDEERQELIELRKEVARVKNVFERKRIVL